MMFFQSVASAAAAPVVRPSPPRPAPPRPAPPLPAKEPEPRPCGPQTETEENRTSSKVAKGIVTGETVSFHKAQL